MRYRICGLLPLLVVLVLWFAPRGARACSCMVPPPPSQALADANAVFEARPYSMNSGTGRAVYSFEVDRVWKGEIGDRVEISTALHSASCGRTYQIGTRYLVYARRSDTSGWTDGLCSRTRASSSAAEDFQVLGEGRRPLDPEAAPIPEPGTEPTEPPRIDSPPPEPPPTTPNPRGCAVEKPHANGAATLLLLLGLGVAIGRRRTVRSPRGRR